MAAPTVLPSSLFCTQALLPLPPRPPALPTGGAVCTEGGLLPSVFARGGAQGNHQPQCGGWVCLWWVGVSVVVGVSIVGVSMVGVYGGWV